MAITKKGQAWELSHSLWMGWVFLCGLSASISFLYIGIKASRVKWLVAGVIYLIPFIMVLNFNDQNFGIVATLWFVMYVISIVHIFIARKEYLLWLERQDSGDSLSIPEKRGLSPQKDTQHQEIFTEADDQTRKLTMYSAKATDPEIRSRVDSIIETTKKIHDLLEKHPERVQDAKRFLNHYLDSACNIMEKYTEIVSQNINTENIESLKAKVVNILDTIKTTSEKQMEKLMEDDILDLETEISFLEKSIKSEGI